MELTVKGDESKIKRLEKELRLRAKRDGLEMSFKDVNKVEDKEQKKVSAPSKSKKKVK